MYFNIMPVFSSGKVSDVYECVAKQQLFNTESEVHNAMSNNANVKVDVNLRISSQ